MRQAFWWDYNFKNFMFSEFNISSVMIFLTTCFGLLLCSIILEWLKLETKVIRSTLRVLRNNQQEIVPETVMTTKYKCLHYVKLFLWLTQQIVAMFLMLTVMSYNGFIFVAVVIGSGIGYFLFGPALIRINIENYFLKIGKQGNGTIEMDLIATESDISAL